MSGRVEKREAVRGCQRAPRGAQSGVRELRRALPKRGRQLSSAKARGERRGAGGTVRLTCSPAALSESGEARSPGGRVAPASPLGAGQGCGALGGPGSPSFPERGGASRSPRRTGEESLRNFLPAPGSVAGSLGLVPGEGYHISPLLQRRAPGASRLVRPSDGTRNREEFGWRGRTLPAFSTVILCSCAPPGVPPHSLVLPLAEQRPAALVSFSIFSRCGQANDL